MWNSVVTYNTGGSGESVSCETGFVVDKGDVDSVAIAVKTICANGKEIFGSLSGKRQIDIIIKMTGLMSISIFMTV